MKKLAFFSISIVFLIAVCFPVHAIEGKPFEDNTIRRHSSHCYSGGMLVGVPLKASRKGYIVKTQEMEISVGQFDGKGTSYVGHSVHVSTQNKKIFDQFQKAVKTKQVYVFEYDYPFCLNPKWEDTHYMIKKFYPLKKMTSSVKIPLSVEADEYRRGTYADGTREGRIIQVERRGWNWFEPTCNVFINLSGLATGDEGKAVENTRSFSIYGEHACQYAEALAGYDVEVEADYTQDYVEVFHDNSRVIHTLSVVDRQSEQTQKKIEGREELLRSIKEELLKDPEFLKKLHDAISDRELEAVIKAG